MLSAREKKSVWELSLSTALAFLKKHAELILHTPQINDKMVLRTHPDSYWLTARRGRWVLGISAPGISQGFLVVPSQRQKAHVCTRMVQLPK